MSDRLDFAALYRDLGLRPGCSSLELRNAYRRQVSRLHPDQGGDAQDTGRLQHLNRLYRAALDFERAHGRLPGSGVLATPAVFAHAAADAGPVLHPTDEDDVHVPPPTGPDRIPRLIQLTAMAGICVLAWRIAAGLWPASPEVGDVASAEHVPSTHVPSTASARAPASAAPYGDLIAPGVDKAHVLDIQGEPLDRHPVRWLYGPSWVEFACDRVVDWYSSPLQPLRVRTQRPVGNVAAADACAH